VIKTVPEVESVFGKAGRADTATDPAPLTMIESWIKLKPKSEWRAGMTADGIVDDLNSRLQMPGLVNSWGYPIKIRMDMVSTGIRTPIGSLLVSRLRVMTLPKLKLLHARLRALSLTSPARALRSLTVFSAVNILRLRLTA